MSGAPVVPQGALSDAERDALQDLVNAVLAISRRQAAVDAARAELPDLMAARDDAEARCRALGLISGRRRMPSRRTTPAPAPARERAPEDGPTLRQRITDAVAGGATTAGQVIARVGAEPTAVYPTLTQLANAGVLARVRVDGTGWVYSVPEGATDA